MGDQRVARGIIIAGHSHLGSFARTRDWLQMGPAQAVRMAEQPDVRVLIGTWPHGTDYWDACLVAANSHVIAISWKGNQHNIGFLRAQTPGIDFEPNSDQEWPSIPDAYLVPELALRDHFAPSFDALQAFLKRAQRAGLQSNLVLLGSPPPIGDNQVVVRRLRAHPVNGKEIAKLLAQKDGSPLSPPLLRLKLWDLLQRMTRDIALDYGCHFCPSPSAAIDAEGYLRSEYWSADATHANYKYGELMVDSLQEMLRLPVTA